MFAKYLHICNVLGPLGWGHPMKDGPGIECHGKNKNAYQH